MRKSKIIPLSYCLFSWGVTCLYGQNGPVGSGGEALGSGGVINYSIGQIDYISASGNSGTMNAGLQQPYEIFTISGIEEKNRQTLISLFPNPASEQINLAIESQDLEEMNYVLYDLQGKLIAKEKLNNSQTNISLVKIPNGIYFLEIMNNTEQLKTFKIIKNQ